MAGKPGTRPGDGVQGPEPRKQRGSWLWAAELSAQGCVTVPWDPLAPREPQAGPGSGPGVGPVVRFLLAAACGDMRTAKPHDHTRAAEVLREPGCGGVPSPELLPARVLRNQPCRSGCLPAQPAAPGRSLAASLLAGLWRRKGRRKAEASPGGRVGRDGAGGQRGGRAPWPCWPWLAPRGPGWQGAACCVWSFHKLLTPN